MKKILLIIALLISCSAQAQYSNDPRDRNYEVYWNDTMSIMCSTVPPGTNMAGPNVLTVNGWYFELHPHYYWMYISQYGLLFTVKAKDDRMVYNHLIHFVELLHEHFEPDWMTLSPHHN